MSSSRLRVRYWRIASFGFRAAAAGEPAVLFRASQAPWAKQIESRGRKGYVTEGPGCTAGRTEGC
jgi:hypothetical protein